MTGDGIVSVCILLIRAGIGALAGIVLVQALIGLFFPRAEHPLLAAIRMISAGVAEPVRLMLPRSLQTGRMDYAPLISVLLLLMIGFGFESLLVILRGGIYP